MEEKRSGLARYENVDEGYLEQRSLRGSAGWILLWALGVGAVISGDFYGWHFGLAAGGFWGLAIATIAMAAMYVCMVFSIAELSAALPHAGGFYSFVRNALGPTGGFVCGLTDTIEYVITPAVIVGAIGAYMNSILASLGIVEELPPAWVWWLPFYGFFVWINIRGVELTLKACLVVTMAALAALLFLYGSVIATGAFDANLLFNLEAEPGHSADWLPFGWAGVFAALPAAIWFYLAIEQLPLAAEETGDVVRDMPKALILGTLTLLALSVLTLVLNSGVGGGVAALSQSETPFEDGIRAALTNEWLIGFVLAVALSGLIASFHSIIYAYGRVLFALSRAGYFPRWISVTNRRNCPHVALIFGAVIGLVCAIILEIWSKAAVGAALLNMAVFGAVISYIMVMASFVKLRISRPDLPRPYRSPLGVPGAIVGALLALTALCATIANEELRPGIWGVAIFLAVGMIYYLVYSRHRLVAQAPEEEIALAEHDNPSAGAE